MFTGAVEDIGTVSLLIRKGHAASVSISTKRTLADLVEGSSIAVNGVCLTVTSVSRNAFTADASSESLKTSNFSHLKIGQKVNLERALALSSRLGGHIMTGHVDGMVELKGKMAVDEGYELVFLAPQQLRRYIIPKGSVGLDGVSLTVAKVIQDGFSAIVVPYTARNTTLGQKQIGDKLNIEADILSKYLDGLLQGESFSPTEKVFLNAGFLPIGIIDN